MTGMDQGFRSHIWAHSPLRLEPDASRTVLRPFAPEYPSSVSEQKEERMRAIIKRLLKLDNASLLKGTGYLSKILEEHSRSLETTLLQRYEDVRHLIPSGRDVDKHHKLMIGGYLSEEYAFEAAGLFNPSIVLHWDQAALPEGALRFVLSLRGIGEGHISSITFRTGVWARDGSVSIDPPSQYAESPVADHMKSNDDAEECLHLRFEAIRDISEAVLFPVSPSQKQGVEDLRLARLTDEDGVYMGTFTAFSGSSIRQELLTTRDFRTFTIRPLKGKCIQNKGMALFPRRIDGRYTMLGRQDNENIWLMTSDDIHRWDEAEKIVEPIYPWEFIQIGNCGSPLEIDEGWLVVTHSVGMVRNYTIGACLLDKHDPRKVLGRTRTPLLLPEYDQPDGYVPNVVYSCGALTKGRDILLPYGVSDHYTGFATTTIDSILGLM